MMMTMHTEGPWTWQSFDYGKTLFLGTQDRGRLVVMDFVRSGMQRGSPRFAIRNAQDDGGIMETATLATIDQFPDAKLIAAAPDLFAACKKAMDRHCCPDPLPDEVYDMMEAAIAKATQCPCTPKPLPPLPKPPQNVLIKEGSDKARKKTG